MSLSARSYFSKTALIFICVYRHLTSGQPKSGEKNAGLILANMGITVVCTFIGAFAGGAIHKMAVTPGNDDEEEEDDDEADVFNGETEGEL